MKKKNNKHSVLAPSSKEWIYCGFAAKFLANKESEPNEASEFGTECHTLAEAYIRKSLNLIDYDSQEEMTIDELKSSLQHYDDEMERLATGYANFVVSTVSYEEKRTGVKPAVFVEQLLEMDYAPDTHGTADTIIISGDTLTVIDNKTGRIKVDVKDEETGYLNSQLAIYGLYAFKLFEKVYPIRKIRLVIYQERIGNISEVTLDKDELLEWEVFVLRPAAYEAQRENPRAVSGSHCKYCPGRNVCRQRAEDAMKIADEVKRANLMTDAEIEELLPELDLLIAYAEDIKAYALKKAIENGKKWKGYKLVESVTRRKIVDETVVGDILTVLGYDPYQKKLKSITDLQKLVGKTLFDELIGEYVVKPKGQPVLAPESDARDEIIIHEEKK
jgi:CRISPR/Cas system-associated exonuclease Cas4 (RecB family)